MEAPKKEERYELTDKTCPVCRKKLKRKIPSPIGGMEYYKCSDDSCPYQAYRVKEV